MKLSQAEYEFILRRDFVSFIERSFYELNPQTPFHLGSHIELIASKLEACRTGKIRRLIVTLPPRYLKSHCCEHLFSSMVVCAQSCRARYRGELRTGFG